MDILYIVGTGSKCNNRELRYSLRSLEKYGKNVGRVFLCGYKPDFVSDQVKHIVGIDKYGCKHKNILYKVLRAIQYSDISRQFILSSDDHYYIKETDFDTLPVYYRREQIPNRLERGRNTDYFRSLMETRGLLEQYGLPIFQTNPHCGKHFDVDVYEENKEIFDRCFDLRHGGELNLVMGNLLIKNGAKPVYYNDCKLNEKTNLTNFKTRVGESECLSSSPYLDRMYLGQFLLEEFPKKSKYEI